MLRISQVFSQVASDDVPWPEGRSDMEMTVACCVIDNSFEQAMID